MNYLGYALQDAALTAFTDLSILSVEHFLSQINFNQSLKDQNAKLRSKLNDLNMQIYNTQQNVMPLNHNIYLPPITPAPLPNNTLPLLKINKTD